MAVRVRCPSCGKGLLARDAALGERRTCPACLAEIDVPETGREAVRAGLGERGEHGPSCPSCGRDVEAIWVNCPWCDEPLRGRDPEQYGRPDLDVRRDRRWTGVVLIVLAVLGGIGVALLGLMSLADFAQAHLVGPMVVLTVELLFLAGLTTLIVFVRSKGNPGAHGVRRVVVGTLAMVGGLIALITCGGLALFVFVGAVCLAANSRW